MRSSVAATAIVAALLTSCVKYHARPLDPPQSEQLFRARTLSDPGLRAFLRKAGWPPASLSLNDLAAVALYFNADLDMARAQWRSAQAAVLTAKGRPNPSVSVGGGYTNAPESPLVFHFDPAFTLVTAGKRGWRILAAEKQAEAARAGVEETAWQVRSRVRGAWLSYLTAIRSRDALHNEQRFRAATASILERRLNVGEVSQPDVNVARTALITVETQAAAAETQVAESAAALAAAVGLPALPEVDTQSLPMPPASLTLAHVENDGLMHRADIRRGLLQYAVAEANLHLEIANQYPDLQLSPGYSFDEGHHKISFGPAFPIPLLNRNQGPIAEAEASRKQSEASFNALQAQAIGEMQTALARYNGARVELAQAEQRLNLIQAREGATLRLVRAGEDDQLALAGLRVEGAVAAAARVDALFRVEEAVSALENAVQQPLTPGPPLPDPLAKP
ncbi:MAG: TolC family protein [Bryobacteraceae bacterium]